MFRSPPMSVLLSECHYKGSVCLSICTQFSTVVFSLVLAVKVTLPVDAME